ncbi:MAG: hypothetical protein D3924_00055 [Candidatus Electrothrix sp. AR4]|nr:hypothetical protein [Candidatus Electrothrix sp. AR4]
MIHIATVHWLDDIWVDIQLAYFEKYLKIGSYSVYAFLNGIDAEKYRERVHYICTEPIQPHVTKLNLLAEEICRQADAEDIIYFIDGDAFPVGDIDRYVADTLKEFDLVAIQRLENQGDPQPHPSFCATTVGFWQEIDGNWGQGPFWKSTADRLRTDTGALLWENLHKRGIDWQPMLRSNVLNLHPLWFGLYHDLIYHHGAAFRTPYCMVDIQNARKVWWKRFFMHVADSRLGTLGRGWVQNAIYSFAMKKQIRQALDNSQALITDIKKDFNFAQQFKEVKSEVRQRS